MPDDLTATLAALRAGDATANEKLRNHFHYLIKDVSEESLGSHIAPEELLGILYISLADAIRRLSQNAISAEDAEQFIKHDLRRSCHEYKREISPSILIPRSTKASRRKRGQPPHPKLKRKWTRSTSPNYAALDDGDDNGEKTSLLETVPKACPHVTSRLVQHGESRMDELVSTQFEQDVADLLAQGYTRCAVALALCITEGRVRKVIENIRKRAARAGFKLPKSREAA